MYMYIEFIHVYTCIYVLHIIVCYAKQSHIINIMSMHRQRRSTCTLKLRQRLYYERASPNPGEIRRATIITSILKG